MQPRKLHPLAEALGVLVPGETILVLEEPTGTPLVISGKGEVDARELSNDAVAATERLDLRERAAQVFAGNVAPISLHLVLSPALDGAQVVDLFLGTADNGRWLNVDELDTVSAALGLPRGRELYHGPFDPSVVASLTSPFVLRPEVERLHPSLGRVAFSHHR